MIDDVEVGDVGRGHVEKVDGVDEIVGEVKYLDVVCMLNDVVYKIDVVPEENCIVGQVDIDVVDVMADQELLEVVERCLEGTEEVTNPNDVEYAVDDVHHSFDGVVVVHLVHDALLNFDVGLLLDVSLDDLLGLDELLMMSFR